MKKFFVNFIITLVVLIFNLQALTAVQLNSKNKVNIDITGYMEFGYYRPDNMDKSFRIDEAGVSFTAVADSLKGIIEINYKDSSDTYFSADKVYFRRLAAMMTQANGGIIIGKYENKSMLRTAEFQNRNTMNYAIMDRIVNKHTPVGAQYIVESKSIDFSIGLFNGLTLTSSNVYSGVYPAGNILCLNDDLKSGGNKTDFSGGVNFKTDAGISIKSGYLTGKLNSADIDFLNAVSYAPGDTSFNSDDKKILYFALEQKIQTLNFSAAYYLIDISSLKNKTLEITGKINMSQGVTTGFSYTQAKYSGAPKPSLLFGKRRQYIINAAYAYKYLNIGYEYVINSETFEIENTPNIKNNAHVIKAVFIF